MKRIALFIAALMILSFGLANAQDAITVSFTNTWMDGPTMKLNPGPTTITFTLNVTTDVIAGSTNGFKIYYQDGTGNYGVPVGAWAPNGYYEASNQFVNYVSNDGTGGDQFGFGGFLIGAPGIPIGTHALWSVTGVNVAVGETFCIDTAFYPPGGVWLWSTNSGDVEPDWYDAPYCLLVEPVPNIAPAFLNCPGVAQVFNHCAVASIDLNASDTEGDPFTFSMVSGIGSIDANSGVWSFSPTLANVGPVYDVVVRVADAFGGTDCAFQVSFSNVAPTIACQAPVPVGMGNTATVDINAANVDCDPGTFSIVGVAPAPVGTYSIDANTGVITFNTVSPADGGFAYVFTVEYSDGNLAATCDQTINVLTTEPYEIVIEKTHGTFQGGHEYVDVTVTKGSEAIWGFDILIAYDASALSFQTAVPGDIYTDCGWEYFTYRYGANGNCSGGCPSGLLRVVGIAETNNGANHPDCFMTTKPFSLFTLDFLVTDNRTFECMYVPIRFFWMDCGDNALSFHQAADVDNPYSQTLAVSRFIYEFEGGASIAKEAAFPTYFGAPSSCLIPEKPGLEPQRFIDFYNGGVDIVCADSIDARGDVNLNGTAYEIADAVLYSNYFVFGLGVFDYYQAQVAASDVNADGIPLSVADLVYLIRVVVGDALPYPKVAPVAAKVTYEGSVITVSDDMGAAYVVVNGNVAPELLIDGVEMKYAYDATENVTRVLVVGMEKGAAINGSFLNANGPIVSVEMATYEGAPVSAKLIPASFQLAQNYPNPFNPTTTISFGLPTASQYTITVYNVTGQIVSTINGQSDAGTVSVEFDASNLSSGIYFYNVEAGSYSATKKMVLVK
jgi:hypothetical protein